MTSKLFLFAGIVCLLLPWLAAGLENARTLLFLVGAFFLGVAGIVHAVSRR